MMDATERLPERIETVEQLEDLLSEPTPGVVETMARLDGDVLVLGVGGKMGPTLARMARRASEMAGVTRRIIGVSRFSSEALVSQLRSHGIETIRCDLLDAAQLQSLPEAPNVLFMAGMKFGATGREALTWAMNCFLPGQVASRFHGSRIVAFSTGNVYGLTPVAHGGSVETDLLRPVGEYAQSCVGRERILEYQSGTFGIPMTILRLNYATELRYGVLVDLAQRVQAGEPVELPMGHFNALWQADANAMALQAFDHATSPPFVVNLAGRELLSVRRVAEQFARLFGKSATFRGTESADALLSNGQLGYRLFGYARARADQVMHWIAHWIARDGPTLGKPTHFENREGAF
jgi:nucleoside-diphosphate-sugar epimerase